MAPSLTDVSPLMVPSTLGAASVFLALRTLYRWWTSDNNRSGLPYPPGPKGYPIINNLFDMPVDNPWEGYAKLAKQYGDIIFLRVLRQPIMILSSQKRVDDLFEKRSAIYSSRPHSVMMHELLELNNLFSIVDYGPWWRKHRSMFHQEFNAAVVAKYHPIIKVYIQGFLVALSEGTELSSATRNAIAGAGIKALYGVHVDSLEDPFISVACEVTEGFETAGVPGRFLVDTLPFLKYVPRWVPGAGFQKWADRYREATRRVLNEPFEYVWELHKKGASTQCIATDLIDRLPEDPMQRREATLLSRNVCTMAHLGAVDTTYGMVMAFFLAMVIHPEIQQAAQDELDRVVGPYAIPDFSHQPDLPYIKAVIRETLRWHQVLPLAVPHRVTEDDIYDGYFIPKGTVVFGNAWGMMHDEEVFPEPMEFQPERFLTKDGRLNADIPEPTVLFGYGRRICPGRYLALDIMYFIITSTLALYNIRPGKDEHGNLLRTEPKFLGGALMRPAPFRCIFEPRSPQAATALQGMTKPV